MSAVSAEFSHAHANVAGSSDRRGSGGSPASDQESNDQAAEDAPDGRATRAENPGASQTRLPGTVTPGADFGANEWLVDELFQQYQADPSSVDRAWWNFFADYRREPSEVRRAGAAPAPSDSATGQRQTPAAAPPQAPGSEVAHNAARPATANRQEQAQPAAASSPQTRPASQPGPADGQPGRPGQGAAGSRTLNGGAASAGQSPDGVTEVRLRGAASRTVANMEASLSVPTATSVRAVPAKLLVDNRIVINNHLARGRGGKVSFTHLIGYAVVKALAAAPAINDAYAEADGKPVLVRHEHVNLGLAIDVQKEDGSRQLLVPNIKAAEQMDFRQFWLAYEDAVRKTRTGKLTVEDFAGTTISLTNPGTIGTVQSVPRLMPGQGCIVGVGAMEYPAAYQGASAETLARLAISQTVTLTFTYDHRIIPGAQSGEFLRIISGLLLGENEFYDEIFISLRIPYEPVRWVRDIPTGHENDISKAARVHELIHAYRVRGHLLA